MTGNDLKTKVKATLTFREIICAPALHSHTKPCTKFEVSSSSGFGDMFDRIPKIVGSCDLSHAHFQGKLFVCPLGIPHIKQHTNFEVCSSSSFRDIAL